MNSSKVFSVAIRLIGTDTEYWSAAVSTPEGVFWELIYDSNPHGRASDTPSLRANQCSALQFNASFPYILCLRHQ